MDENNKAPDNGRKRAGKRGTLAQKAAMLLAILVSARLFKEENEKQFGNTPFTAVMVTNPCRLVR